MKRLHKAYDAGEMPEEQDESQPVAPGTVNSGGHNGKRLHPGGKYYPHQTEPKKKAMQKEREETRRLTTIYQQLTKPRDWGTLTIVIIVNGRYHYLRTTENAGSKGRLAILVENDGSAKNEVGKALLSYGLRNPILESFRDERICKEANILCNQLKGQKMSQLVSNSSTFAERGTNPMGGLRFYSCNLKGGGAYHVLLIPQELSAHIRSDQHGPRCDGATASLPALQRAYPLSTLKTLDCHVPALLEELHSPRLSAERRGGSPYPGLSRKIRTVLVKALPQWGATVHSVVWKTGTDEGADADADAREAGMTPQQSFFERQSRPPKAGPTKTTDSEGATPGGLTFGWQACDKCAACENHRGCRNPQQN